MRGEWWGVRGEDCMVGVRVRGDGEKGLGEKRGEEEVRRQGELGEHPPFLATERHL